MTGVICALAGSGGFGAVVSPTVATGNSSSNSVTVTASPPGAYTYSWVRLDGEGIVATSSTSATTTFTASPPLDPSGETRTATFACDVSLHGSTLRSNAVSVELTRPG